MRFNLIVCTYQRGHPLLKLLHSVKNQSLYPEEILIIDGSPNDETKDILQENKFEGLKYFKVSEKNRGLTRQRNFGIAQTGENIEIVCFLDDDTVLEPDYFMRLINTYRSFPATVGVGGYILNEVEWKKRTGPLPYDAFEIDGYSRKLGSRNLLRKKLGLLSDMPPGVMPEFSNGLSISFLPPVNKIYPVDYFMGGVSSFRKIIFKEILFSKYFHGYSLYEDMEFCLRASRIGQLYVNTAAKLRHYHELAGRPNSFQYGKMVILNGWYVWRVKYPKPTFQAKIKWHSTAFLLTLIRFLNVFTTSRRSESFMDASGRVAGWMQLLKKSPSEHLK